MMDTVSGNTMQGAGAGTQTTSVAGRWKRWEPLSGIAFVACFIGGVAVSSPPAENASNREWLANYTGQAHQIQHFATGIFLVLAGLCLVSFLTTVWTRIAAVRRPDIVSPLPVVAAGVSAACICFGGVLMATFSAVLLLGSNHMPSADLLRFGNNLGFGMVGVAGMLAGALSIAALSVQARSAGLFGTRLMVFGLVVAVILLGSIAFLPILALLIWLIVVTIVLMRAGN